MHILHIETGRHLYGGALQVFYLLKALGDKNCQNSLVCVNGSEIGRAARPYASVWEVPMAGEVDPRFPFRLRRIIKRLKPEIIHVHSRRGADIWGGIMAVKTNIRRVITRRVDNPEPKWMARMKYGLYDQVVTISEGIRRVLLSEGIQTNKIVCIPSAVDSRQYENPCDEKYFYEEFDLSPDNKAIGVVAQFIERKGHRYLIEAIPDILKSCPETRFLFFGQGPLKQALQRMCQEYGVAETVRFCGFRKDLQYILPHLYLVVHPALMEGLGVALLEASAAAVPIVATRVGGVPEIVLDGQNGCLVEAGNRIALTEAVIDLIRDPVKSRMMGSMGKEIVMSKFSVEAMVMGYLDIYRRLSLNSRLFDP